MKVLKIILNPRVASAIVSAVSAIICACFAGCKLACGSFRIENLEASIFNSNYSCTTNNLEVL